MRISQRQFLGKQHAGGRARQGLNNDVVKAGESFIKATIVLSSCKFSFGTSYLFLCHFTMPSLLRSALFALLPAAALASNRSYISTLSYDAQGLLNESMSWMDTFYDSSAGYLHDLSAATALNHETRSSAWYAIGLLARAQGNDVDEALKIITNVIGGQYKVKEDQWWVVNFPLSGTFLTTRRYGDYQQEPEEPEIGSPDYPPSIYGSWDPNWRGFVGTTFIVGLEEFGHLITPEVTCLMLESLKNATIGVSLLLSSSIYPFADLG